MNRPYTDEELQRLHLELYDILREIVRVCDELSIPYFIQGGTAIGAFFEQSILPWDDDIGVGITREHYTRFLREAPSHFSSGYFMQWVGTDPHTPFYFVKVRKNHTLFVEKDFSHLPIHHGIFIDVFPFDKVPDNPWLQKLHRDVSNFFNCCFMGKDIWMWKHVRKCEISHPTNRGLLPCLANWLVDVVLTKRAIFCLLSRTQAMFNHSRLKTTYYNMVLMPRDHISVASIESPQLVPFGPLHVWAPSDLETYLRHHYPRLRRYIPKEEQQNHRPELLSFDAPNDRGPIRIEN